MTRILKCFHGLFGNTAARSRRPAPSRPLVHATKKTLDPVPIDEASGKLEHSLFCWLLDVGPAQLTQPDEHAGIIIAQMEGRIRSGKLEDLPRQPLILPMLLQTLSDENTAREELVTIILKDPALTDRVLQAANSPYFRVGNQHVESVDHAVFLIGHEGIRNVVSASIMRPMLAARDSTEVLFSERAWRWGMTCGKSAEAIARLKGGDSGAHFLLGLLPALSYVTLRREAQRLYRGRCGRKELPPGLLYAVIPRFGWATAHLIAREWNLPPRFHASLLSAERPAPAQLSTPLNDGVILGTREVLQHAQLPNLSEEELRQLLLLEEPQLDRIRGLIAGMLKKGENRAR